MACIRTLVVTLLMTLGDIGFGEGISVTSTITPLAEMTERIEQALNEVEREKVKTINQIQETLNMLQDLPSECVTDKISQEASFLQDWDFDSCVNLTDDVYLASQIAEKAGSLVSSLTETSKEITALILDCPVRDPRETAECYRKNLVTLREAVQEFKNSSVPFAEQGSAVVSQIRVDLDECIGIPVTSNTLIMEHIAGCRNRAT